MSELAVENTSSNKTEASDSPDLGLSSSPFEDTFAQIDITSSPDVLDNIPFFMGGDRRAVLDEVMHLCQFSSSVVAVLGEAGVGKTALVCQAVSELSETAQCCVLSSSVMMSEEDILTQLIDQLGLFTPEEASVDARLSVIDQYQPSGMYQRVVLVVDDAHHLNNNVLSLFIRILQGQVAGCLHVLLVGDSSLLLRLDQLERGEVLVYDIPLCPFTADELAYYLSFKLSSVGYQGGELFDHDVVQAMWKDTRGIPASVNRAASNVLLSNEMAADDENKLGLPMIYMAALVVLLAALIMAVFYVGDDPLPTGVDLLGDKVLLEELVTEVPIVDSKVVEVPVESERLASEISSSPKTQLDSVVSEALPKPLSPELDKLTLIVEAPKLPELPKPKEEPIAIKAPVAVIEPVVEKVAADIVPAPAPAPAPAIERTVDEDAVMFWPIDAYTLQVMAAGQLKGVRQFVDTQPNSRLLRVVGFERNKSPWYVVLVGVYESSQGARLAIKDLPKTQRNAKPWPRKISEIQGKITDFRRR